MTQAEMNILVPQKLKAIEKEYNIEVLWAVESGSRAWGFASSDSDFDVRFIYKHKPAYYLSLQAERDVIELPVDEVWDLCGWDLDKTLRLLYKSNPSLYEWLGSPIRYIESDFSKRLTPLLEHYYAPKNMLYHYLNTAKHTIKDYLLGSEVIPKKYFYALRPILACHWIKANNTPPPVLFDTLVKATLPRPLENLLTNLLAMKVSMPEKVKIAPIQELQQFLIEEVQLLDEYMDQLDKEAEKDWDGLNAFFIKEINDD